MSEQRRADLEAAMAELAFEISLAVDQRVIRDRVMFCSRLCDGLYIAVTVRPAARGDRDVGPATSNAVGLPP